jgi:NADH-quinone oxidoreductase subunit G
MDQFQAEKPWSDLTQKIEKGAIDTLLIVGPQNQAVYSDAADKVKSLGSKVKRVVWMAPSGLAALGHLSAEVWQIPLKTFFETSGTYINHSGRSQKAPRGFALVEGALALDEMARAMGGESQVGEVPAWALKMKENHFTAARGQL